MLSDRYSCQEHGKKIEAGCVACEVYGDIKQLEQELEQVRASNELALGYIEDVINNLPTLPETARELAIKAADAIRAAISDSDPSDSDHQPPHQP